MTAVASLRSGEIAIQDDIQRQLEARLGQQKVLLWKHPVHKALRVDPISQQLRSQVIMEDLVATDDNAYGAQRCGIQINVMGLVSAIECVNRAGFQHWLDTHPTVKLTVRGLAEIAAHHLADLFETAPMGDRMATWRIMLALGEAHAWEGMAKRWGLPHKKDPRFLAPAMIPGAPKGAKLLPYRPCWPASNNVGAFLDPALAPGWIDTISQADKHPGLANEYRQEAARRGSQCQVPPPVHTADGLAWEGSHNRHYWIREYHMGNSDVHEYPDFALLINGLPLVLTEVKKPGDNAGLARAVSDFLSKPTYQGAAIGVATDGEQAIVSAAMSGQQDKWVCYDGNLTDDPTGSGTSGVEADVTRGHAYLFDQVLSRPHRLEFFLRQCGAINEHGRYFTARSQQYQALARLERDLEWVDVCNAVRARHGLAPVSLGNRLIRHTQRTGKTHTMIRAVHLAQGCHPGQFQMSLLMVGEVLILGQIHADMIGKNLGLSDQALNILRVESRLQLAQVLQRQRDPSMASRNLVVLANMQKIQAGSAGDDASKALPDSDKVLVVLDEGHLSQTGGTAEERDLLLPDANHLLLTATPKSSMSQHYGITEQWHVLDDFGYGVAKKAGMVCPVVYRRHPYRFEDDAQAIGRLTEALKPALTGILGLDDEVLREAVHRALRGSDQGDADQTDHQDGLSNEESVHTARSLVRQIRRQLEREFIQERLDAIVDQLDRYEHALPRLDGKLVDDSPGNLTAARVFTPRALAFGRDTQSVIDIIEYIQALNKGAPEADRNVYRGRRFALDVSDFGKDPTAASVAAAPDPAGTGPAKSSNPKNPLRGFEHLNPGVVNDTDLKDRLETADPARQIHVLLAVGKYTKGYDNDQLAVVALLRNIAEPSLMNQIYTRPATKRQGKPAGVCLDLAFGLGNVVCWRTSLELYDQAVDLDQFYTDEQTQALALAVKDSLTKTSKAVNLDLQELADLNAFTAAFEALGSHGRETQGREFILHARRTTSLISKLPDASLYADVRAPLRGLKRALEHVQSMFPQLMRAPGDQDLVLQGGHTPQALGSFIQAALEVLANPTLSGLMGSERGDSTSLKSLLGVSMEQAHDIDGHVLEDDVLKQARERQQLRTAERVLEAILGKQPQGTGAEASKPKGRDVRGHTALTDALNRALDRIRDDLHQLDDGSKQPRQSPPKAVELAATEIGRWRAQAQSQGGVLQALVYHKLDLLVDMRAEMAGLGKALAEEPLAGVVAAVLQVASEHIVQSFNAWSRRLPAQSHDQPAQQLAESWRHTQPAANLTDFLTAASKREDIHGQAPDEWIAGLLPCAGGLRTILGSDMTGEEGLASNVMTRALVMALEEDSHQEAFTAWHQRLKGQEGGGARP